MVHKKSKSKRITLKKKYFVEKKVREHHRKLRREAKKNPNKRKGLKKDPGIPNLYPFKQQFVDKMERLKEKQERDVERQKEQRAKEHERRRQMSIQEMRESARRREQSFTERQVQKEELESQGITDVKDSSRRAYYREFKKVVTAADVILEVLDARDPLGCRCPEIEQSILAQDPNKKIILILNKIDLVPGENVEKWLKYLRNEFPTLAFKCSTQKQKRNIGRNDANVMNNLSHTELMQSSGCLGAETLLQLLKNYCRSLNMKTSVTVGIIGYPNVGKSSLINSLKRSRAVGVGATPGFTKTMQEIHIDKHVKLLDCPGIVFSSHSSESDLILRNCMKVEQLDDPLAPVEAILKRCKKEKLLEIYCIPNYEDSKEFLSHVARRTGKLIRGGIPNYDKAAKIVLADWNAGKIPFYSMPPALTGVHVSASIVSNWAQEMNLADVMEQERTTVISSLKPSSESDYIVFDSTNYGAVDKGFVGDEMADAGDEYDDGGEGEYMGDEYEDGEEDDENGMEDDYASGDEGAPLDPSSLAYQKQKMRDDEDSLNVQVNRKLQQLLKKKKKGKEVSERIRLPKIPKAYEKSQEDEEDSAFSFARDFVADNDMVGSDEDEEEEEDGGEGEEDEEEEEEEEEDGEKEKGRKKQDVDLFDVDDI